MNLQAIVESMNPWWADPARRAAHLYPVRRSLQTEVLGRLRRGGDRRATVVLGPRQVGKTTLLLQTVDDLLAEGWPPQNLTYFDFSDDRVVEEVTAREVAAVRPAAAGEDHPRILLLDEVHLAPHWDRWLKQAVDRREARIVVTDSAASLLRDRGRESGQGRWDEYILEGLSFREFVSLSAAPGESSDEALEQRPDLLERYLALGGFPEHVNAPDFVEARRRLRSNIVERAILRDLANQVEDPRAVRDLFVYLVQESGGQLVKKMRARDLERDARSIGRWMNLLEDTFLVSSLRRRTGPAAALRSKPKVYASDHGLITAFDPFPGRSEKLRGQLFEAVVYRHLRELAREGGWELSYFRIEEDKEIDFVLESSAVGIGVEVTQSLRPEKKLGRLRAANEKLGAERLVLIHGGFLAEEREGVRALPLLEFLRQPAVVLEGLP